MNFDDAIKAHMDWKLRLRAYINKTGTEKFDPAVVEKDNQCALGKWIYGEGATHNSVAGFQELVTAHADFHKCAAGIIRKCDAGQGNENMINDGSDFYKFSSTVVQKIISIRKKVQSAA